MDENDQLQDFLKELKSENRSSPYAWHNFYMYLKTFKTSEHSLDPDVPLILAASGASAADKFNRLHEQLQWSMEQGNLRKAIDWLEALPIEDWNYSPPENWHKSSYF